MTEELGDPSLTIHLLGSPLVERHGVSAPPPRGRKAWAVLAYLALNEHPVPRRRLAELLFSEADDPLGALRWTLAELRRTTGSAEAFRGDPVAMDLDAASIDVLSIRHRGPTELLELRGDLLDGLVIEGCAVFESWLVVERFRIAAEIEGRLRQAAIAALSDGRAADAVELAAQLVARNVLDEGNHELLVRCLTAAGDEAGALRQVAVCEDLLRRELGISPSPSLRAASRQQHGPNRVVPSPWFEVQTLLDAGRAAVGAGAVEAGLDCLYRATDRAASCDDPALHAKALLALGSALVHGVRGRDGEGSIVLDEAMRFATAAGDRRSTATACRELGFVEVQAGRRPTATEWLAKAADLADDDEGSAAVLGVQGMNASDAGRSADAIGFLEESVERAQRCGDERQQAWSLSILGRTHLLRGERSQALDAIDRSIGLVERQRWMAFLPWPRALKAELELDGDRTDVVADDIERAWALSCQLSDPCWEGMTARVMGLHLARQGDHLAARTWLEQALKRCDAVTDTYQWVKAYVLDAAAQIALDDHDHERADELVTALALLSARCDMQELVVRAHLHRFRLGVPAALDAARLLGSQLDNPQLHLTIRRAETTGPR